MNMRYSECHWNHLKFCLKENKSFKYGNVYIIEFKF